MSTPNNEFLLVPHDLRNDSIPTIPADLHQPVMVTDMWVERCLHQKKNIKPEENVTNTPFRRFPIAGFERLVVCSTRFEDVDLLHVSKAVKLMGATYDEEFSPKASVLVCNKMVPGNEKLRHARHWNTPVVTADWLWSSIRSGKLREFEAYLVQPCSVNPDPSTDEHKEELRGQPRGESKPSKTEQIESATITKSSSPRTHEMKDRSPKSADTGPFSRNDITTIHNDKQDQPPIPTDSKTFPQPIPHDSAPLREISPNSSPPKPTSPLKPTTTTTTEPPSKLPSRDPNLSSTISSLLAHHQNARSLAAATKPNTTTSPNPSPTKLRRKRQLLGRAPSNASNLSRASSVDTINTDGVGTP
ncbi:MAG: hypothetical protein LQ338_007653, partial [Usnochroma carphineum]